MDDRQRKYYVDFHIHTVLSPCGDLEMGATDIVERAIAERIDAIAICDHNIVSNFPAILGAVEDTGSSLLVIPGAEIQTSEDIHVLGLFPNYSQAVEFQEWLHRGLNEIHNDPDIFGPQLEIDKDNNIISEFDLLLVQSVNYTIEEVLGKIREYSGLSILAHIDRPSFSYPSVLGPVPPDLDVDALELSRNVDILKEKEYMESYPGRVFTRSSDAHFLSEIKRNNTTILMLYDLSFKEIALAFDPADNGRKISGPFSF